MNLLEDALIQYEELEASFAAVLNDNTSIWFGKFVDPSPNDDSMPLLSVTKKPYRDLILANTISVFDFRIYILAREAILLGKMGVPDKILRKVNYFLSILGGRLRSCQVSLAHLLTLIRPNFVKERTSRVFHRIMDLFIRAKRYRELSGLEVQRCRNIPGYEIQRRKR